MSLIDQPWLQAHLAHYRADPVAAHDWDTAPVGGSGIRPTLLLTTLGAHSGEPRAVPLLYQPCGEGYVVVGSRGGSSRHPAWYVNLLKHPDCSAQVGRLHCPLRARFLTGAERERYWSLMTHCWPAYLDYQKRTTRQLPVVILRLTGSPTLTA